MCITKINHGNGLVEYISYCRHGRNLYWHHTLLNNMRHGEWRDYSHGNKIRFHSYWKNGKMEGEVLDYN